LVVLLFLQQSLKNKIHVHMLLSARLKRKKEQASDAGSLFLRTKNQRRLIDDKNAKVTRATSLHDKKIWLRYDMWFMNIV
jgi:hypothetical protein